MSDPDRRRALSLADTVRFVITTLVRWAQQREWGELRIGVRDGQIYGLDVTTNYRERVPAHTADDAATQRVARELAGVR